MRREIRCLLLVLMIVSCLYGCGAGPEAATEPTIPETTEEAPVTEADIFALQADGVILEKHGQSVRLHGGNVDPSLISWESMDTSVATVDAGVVTAVERGQTTVLAHYEDQTISCQVVCDLPVLPKENPDAAERDPMYLMPDMEVVDSSFFDDAVFIGDSQGLALYMYAARDKQLGNAAFLARNSYSIYNASRNKMLLKWQGSSYRIEDAVQLTGKTKVFIMLGMNDVGNYKLDNMDKPFAYWEDVIARIREKNPEAQIYIQSIFYAWTGGETKALTNEKIRTYNELLRQFCQEHDCVYIDVASWLVDSTGGTATCYSSDKYVHINNDGMQVWIGVLKACTDYD